MPQFALYRNRNPASRTRFPLLLDVQSDLLDPLATRVVVPLTPAGAARTRAMQKLTPVLKFDGKDYLMLTPKSRVSPRANSVRLQEICHRAAIALSPQLIFCSQVSRKLGCATRAAEMVGCSGVVTQSTRALGINRRSLVQRPAKFQGVLSG